jgi:hypothetical protein
MRRPSGTGSKPSGRGRYETRPDTPATPAPDQDVERLLLLSLIRIHLSRASTDVLQALERDLQRVPNAAGSTAIERT